MDELLGGETTDEPSTLSNNNGAERRNSLELADIIRNQVRQQVIEELLEACGDDDEKKKVVRELAATVVTRNNYGATTTTTTSAAAALPSSSSSGEEDSKDSADKNDDDSDDESSDDESSDDDEDANNKYKWADVESIDEIEDSPYEAGASAEVGEGVFEKFQALLEPEEALATSRRSSSGMSRPTKKAIETLGSNRARAMVTANFQIAQSGLLYSPYWLEGNIRQLQVEGLTAPMLLLCLQQQRFARAEIKGVLTKLVEDLRLASIIQEALDDWDLDGQFPNLANCSREMTTLPFHRSHRTECQKCQVFVARAFCVMNFLKRKSIKGGIAKKVLACFRIMEGHLEFEKASASSSSSHPEYPTHIQVPNHTPQTQTHRSGGSTNQEEEESCSPSRAARRGPLHPSPSSPSESSAPITAIEKLDMETGEVLAWYPSMKEANISLGKHEHNSGIRNALRPGSDQLSSAGYFWRRAGSTTPKHAVQVEKLDLKSGKVLESYQTLTAANASIGKAGSHPGIRNVVDGKQTETGGFFWRLSGSTKLPEAAEESTHSSPQPREYEPYLPPPIAVEKLDLETGKVLARYASAKEANISIGKEGNSSGIRKAVSGNRKSSSGYFWRRAGSTVLPEGSTPSKPKTRPKSSPKSSSERDMQDTSDDEATPETSTPKHAVQVEKLDLKSGKVLESYSSLTAANVSIGRAGSNPGIRNVVDGKQTETGGFFWRLSGSTKLPEAAEESTHSSPQPREYEPYSPTIAVEKLDLETGMVLARYASAKEANISIGIEGKSSGIRNVVAGNRKSSSGYFWRRAGSTVLPEGSTPSKPKTRPKSSPKSSSERDMQDTSDDDATPETSTPKHAVQVEKLDLKSGKVLESYSSLTAANVSIGRAGSNPGIRNVVDGKQTETGGFFWRLSGSTKLPEGVKESLHCSPQQLETGPVPVEKLNLQTGEVLGWFPSIGRASSSQGVDKSAVRKVLAGKSKSSGGFFWRSAGSTTLPASLETQDGNEHQPSLGGAPTPKKQSVEQVHPQTGKILARYPSIAEANISLGKHKQNSGIAENLSGRQRSSAGFLWRRASPVALARDLQSEGESESIDKASEDLHTTQAVKARPHKDLSPEGHGHSHANCPSSPRNESPRKRLRDDSNKKLANPSKKARRNRAIISETNEEDTGSATHEALSLEPTFDLNQLPAVASESVGNGSDGHASMRQISAMIGIVDSPYQGSATAEVGEQMFEFFKSLLIPKAGIGRRQVGASDHAIKVFGESLAQKVIDASSKIGISGMVYSTEWSEGTIRGVNMGSIPKPVLLLLLQEQRLSRPGVRGALLKVVTDFELCSVMTKALLEWKLAEKFSKISEVTTHSLFITKQLQCLKCLVFVARVYHCMQLLRVKTMTESIRLKVEACLQILEANFGHRPPRGKDMGSTIMYQAVESSDDDSSVDDAFQDMPPPKDITKSSHVLFQQAPSPVRVEKKAKLPGVSGKRLGGPSPDKVGVSTNSAIQRPSYPPNEQSKPSPEELNDDEWFPYDSNTEVVLTPTEVETAWLVEECIYCLRNREINWRFIYKYASPTLRVELRKSVVNQLEKIVRLKDNIVSERFGQLRKEIRRSLLKGSMREKMKDKIPKERLASRQTKGKTPAPQQGISQTTTQHQHQYQQPQNANETRKESYCV